MVNTAEWRETLRRQKRYKLAEAHLQELLERAKVRQHNETQATASHHLSWVWLSAGKPERARQLCGEAIGLYEQVSNLRGLADAYEQLGPLTWRNGTVKRRFLAWSDHCCFVGSWVTSTVKQAVSIGWRWHTWLSGT